MHSTPLLGCPHQNIAIQFGMEKLEWWGYPRISACDRQTDGQTDIFPWHRPCKSCRWVWSHLYPNVWNSFWPFLLPSLLLPRIWCTAWMTNGGAKVRPDGARAPAVEHCAPAVELRWRWLQTNQLAHSTSDYSAANNWAPNTSPMTYHVEKCSREHGRYAINVESNWCKEMQI